MVIGVEAPISLSTYDHENLRHFLFQIAVSAGLPLFWLAVMLSHNGFGSGWIVPASVGVWGLAIISSMVYLAHKYPEL